MKFVRRRIRIALQHMPQNKLVLWSARLLLAALMLISGNNDHNNPQPPFGGGGTAVGVIA